MAATAVTRVGGPTVEKSQFQLEDQEQRPNHRCYYYLGLPLSPAGSGTLYFNCPPWIKSDGDNDVQVDRFESALALRVRHTRVHGAPESRVCFTRRSMRSILCGSD